MKVKVNRPYLGHVSVRDYIVKDAIADKEDLIIECDGKTRTYPYRSLKTHLLNTSGEVFKSKFDKREYTLIDFPWKPVKL